MKGNLHMGRGPPDEFAKLLGAEAFFGYFITLLVIKIVNFIGKMMNHS
jgi:hypothetical protein